MSAVELSARDVEAFRGVIYRYYERHGRSFPWRETTDPYSILVSEVMLQQTQTSRAVPKYRAFLDRFPDVEALASASLQDVLEAWQGLGYNRRAMHLRQAAIDIVARYGGVVPRDEASLRSLPGIGPYTAAAVQAFAFDLPAVVMDTNVRTVFIHFFFPGLDAVDDTDIRPLVEATMDGDNPRRWYSALMDYGAMLKQRHDNPGRKSTSYNRQSRFVGSDRQIRGAVVRLLLDGPMELRTLVDAIDAEESRVLDIIDRLRREHMVALDDDRLSIPRQR
jgi:A/G-specific adenine glycosylase